MVHNSTARAHYLELMERHGRREDRVLGQEGLMEQAVGRLGEVNLQQLFANLGGPLGRRGDS